MEKDNQKEKDIFAKNLNYWMNNRNKTQMDLMNDLELSSSTVSDWCNAKKYPRMGTVQMLADYLGIKKSDLVEEKDKTDELGNPVVEVPLLGTVKAGYDYLAQENWIGTVDISKKLAETGEFFALKIHGDSMSPTFIENDTVVVRKQDDFENGDIVVALINGEEATVKKGKKSENSILLQPLNTSYEPLIFTKEEMETIPVKIIGVVKKLDREF